MHLPQCSQVLMKPAAVQIATTRQQYEEVSRSGDSSQAGCRCVSASAVVQGSQVATLSLVACAQLLLGPGAQRA